MRQHTYNTQNGSQVNIQIITERENLADKNFTNPCFKLEVRVNDNLMYPQQIQEHSDYPYGLIICMPSRGRRPKVPLDKTARRIWDKYQAESKQLLEQRLAADRKYEESKTRIERAMNQ